MTNDTVTGNMSSENINFTRLCKLLIGEGTIVLRDVFDSIYPPKSLQSHLLDSENHAILKDLKTNEILSEEQWQNLYPDRVSTVTSSSFDITVLYLLLHCICNIKPPTGASDAKPSSKRVIINLEDIKFYLKKLYEYIPNCKPGAVLSDTEFDKYWDDIVNALVGLGQPHYKMEIQKTKSLSLDQEDEKNYILDLETWNKSDESLIKFEAPRLGAMQQLTPKKDEIAQKTKAKRKRRRRKKQTNKEGANIQKPSSEKACESNQGEEARVSIDQQIEDLKSEIKVLRLDSDNKDQTIKELKQKITKLEKKIEQMGKNKKALQTKLDNLKHDINSKIHNLNIKNEKTEEELNNTKAEMRSQTNQIQKLEADVRKLQEKEMISEVDKARLHLGEMCCVIQSLMYKYVHPQYHDPDISYKVKHIQKHINSLVKADGKTDAKTKWTYLKEKQLKLKDHHVEAMKWIQYVRNTEVAHPEVKEESKLREYANLLDEKGKLKGWLSLSIVNELIEMWKQLTG